MNISVNIIYYYWHTWEIFFLQSLRRSQLNNDTNTEENDQKTTWHLSRWLCVCVCVFNVIVGLWFVSLQSKSVSLFPLEPWSHLSLSVTEQYVLLSLISLTSLLSPCHSFSQPLNLPTHSLSLMHIINSISTFRPLSLLSPALNWYSDLWFYFRTTSSFIPTSGLLVCTAASLRAFIATMHYYYLHLQEF